MNDDTKELVERLRRLIEVGPQKVGEVGLRMRQAADTIERLEGAVAYWRDATEHTLDRATESLRESRDTLAQHYEKMRSAVRAFLTKYDQLEPALNNAFMVQQIHGAPYKGDNWSVELENLRKAASTNPTPMAKDSPFNLDDVNAELKKACEKFPEWPTDPLHAVAILGEEFGELTKAVLQLTYEPHKSSREEVRMEAVQTAAMAIRFVESLNRYIYKGCDQHKQIAAERIRNE